MLDYIPRPVTRRAFLQLLGLSVFGVLLDACDTSTPPESPGPIARPSTPLPTAQPADGTARSFLGLWNKGDYAGMYGLLSSHARADITQDDFVKRYSSVAAEATATTVVANLLTFVEQGSTATVQFHVRFDTAIFGPIEEDNALSMVREDNRWGIVWSPGTILRDLAGANSLHFFPAKSTRGNIYDRDGDGIAVGQQAIQVSVWPAEMRRHGVEAQVIAGLAQMLGFSGVEIQRRYANYNVEWKIPIATVSKDVASRNAAVLSLDGVVTEQQDARGYPAAAAAAHLAGYVGQISADELGEVYSRGYREGDILGRSGLERAGEKYLSGLRGGRLAVVDPTGQEVSTLKESPAQQSLSIYSTIDLDLQTFADSVLADKRGSIVVMNVKNGDVLALVSHPSYDPNAFVDSARQKERQQILTNSARPLLNRATQGAYPQGSVQKIVTESAALERGGMAAATPFT